MHTFLSPTVYLHLARRLWYFTVFNTIVFIWSVSSNFKRCPYNLGWDKWVYGWWEAFYVAHRSHILNVTYGANILEWFLCCIAQIPLPWYLHNVLHVSQILFQFSQQASHNKLVVYFGNFFMHFEFLSIVFNEFKICLPHNSAKYSLSSILIDIQTKVRLTTFVTLCDMVKQLYQHHI